MLDIDKMELIRKEHGLTQEAAAKRARMRGKQVWNDIVQGRRKNVTMETLDNIAVALGVNARELIK